MRESSRSCPASAAVQAVFANMQPKVKDFDDLRMPFLFRDEHIARIGS
jgi:hypothetical protein